MISKQIWKYIIVLSLIQFSLFGVLVWYFSVYDSDYHIPVEARGIIAATLVVISTGSCLWWFAYSRKMYDAIMPCWYLQETYKDDELLIVHAMDEQRRIRYWNKGSELAFGLTEQQVLGKPIEEIVIYEDKRSNARNVINGWIKNGWPSKLIELELKDKHNKPIHMLSRFKEYPDSPRGYRVFFIGNDITKQKKELEELWIKYRGLEKSNSVIKVETWKK